MTFLPIIELALRIWLRILETTPDAVLAEQSTEAWTNFKRVMDWFDTVLKLPEP